MTEEAYQKVLSEIESMSAEDIKELSKKLAEDMKLYIDSPWYTPSPWHAGTPTEKGWYILHYPESKEQPYELAEYDGAYFVAIKPFHSIIVRIKVGTVPYWWKIPPHEEKEK